MERATVMFLVKEHLGLPVVTLTDENRTRPDFTSAWKGCPPGFTFRKHGIALYQKTHHEVCFLVMGYVYVIPLPYGIKEI